MSRTKQEWANWNVALWIDNDYDIYKAKMRFIKRGHVTNETVEAFVMDWFPSGTPDMKPGDLEHVDWHELAQEWIEEGEEHDK